MEVAVVVTTVTFGWPGPGAGTSCITICWMVIKTSNYSSYSYMYLCVLIVTCVGG